MTARKRLMVVVAMFSPLLYGMASAEKFGGAMPLPKDVGWHDVVKVTSPLKIDGKFEKWAALEKKPGELFCVDDPANDPDPVAKKPRPRLTFYSPSSFRFGKLKTADGTQSEAFELRLPPPPA